MVQILPQENTWAEPFKGLGQGLVQGYMQRADENAIRNAVEKLGDKASPRDILNVLTKTNTYRPEAKQEALKNYLGVNEYEQLERKARADQQVQVAKALMEQNKAEREAAIKQEKNEVERLKLAEQQRHNLSSEATETSKLAATAGKEEVKEARERERVGQILEQMEDLTPEQREGLKGSMSLSAAEQMLKDKIKTDRDEAREFSKKLKSDAAKEYTELNKEIPNLESTISEIDYTKKMSDDLSWFSYASGLAGLSGKSKELQNLSFVLMEPIVKIFNPSGPIAQQKLKLIQDKYTITPGDLPQIRAAKLESLYRLAKHSLIVAKKRAELIRKYEGNIPSEELISTERKSDRMMDSMINQDLSSIKELDSSVLKILGDPTKRIGQTITNPKTKEQYYSNGIVWSRK